MGLGILKLVSVGNENTIVNTNPEITFFKKVINKVNVFGVENISQYFKSIPDFGRKVTVNIGNIGDLVGKLSLCVELPEIQPSNHTILPNGIKKMAWVKKIGLSIIKYIDLDIDGILIQRHYNDWLNILYETEILTNTDFENLIGKDIKILEELSNGKISYKLHIPLKFFFCYDNLLPIGSLYKQNVKLHIEFNTFNKCYIESPTHYFEINDNICLFEKGEIIEQTMDNLNSFGKFVYFDNIKKRVYYDKIYNDFVIPNESNKNNTKYNIIGKNTKFSLNPKYNTIIVTDEKYFNITPSLKNAYIIAQYIFLAKDEKLFFQNNKHQFIIPMVNNVLDKDVFTTNSNYKLTLTHPTKILYWRAILQNNIDNKDYFNYSSLPLTTYEEPLIIKNKVVINSIPRVDINNYEFYTFLQTYLNGFKSNDYIYQYSFCNDPLSESPNGTFNFSKIDDSYVQLNMNKIINYQNPANVRLYSVYYNVLVIDKGTSSLKYIH